MSTFTFIKSGRGISLRSQNKHWHIRVMPKNGHLYVSIDGREFGRRVRKRGLTSVTDNLTQFEVRAAALYFYQLARTGRVDEIRHVNYAEIFGSCFQ